MEQIRHQPTTRSWRLLGLTGLALSVALFLNEGQARTLPIPPHIQTVTGQNTPIPEMGSKVQPVEKNHASQLTKITERPEVGTQEMEHEDKSQKKKLGLAILFLGMLAEKS